MKLLYGRVHTLYKSCIYYLLWINRSFFSKKKKDTTRSGSILVLDAFPNSIGEYNSVRLSFFFFHGCFVFYFEVLKTMSYDFLSFEVWINEILIELAYYSTYIYRLMICLQYFNYSYICASLLSPALKVSYSSIWVKERERSSDASIWDVIF